MKQFLSKKIFETKYFFMDYWSIVHLVLFFLIGMYYPNKWGLVIFGSIIFELVENKMAKRAIFLRETMKDTLCDFFFNFLGYYLGMLYIPGGLI